MCAATVKVTSIIFDLHSSSGLRVLPPSAVRCTLRKAWCQQHHLCPHTLWLKTARPPMLWPLTVRIFWTCLGLQNFALSEENTWNIYYLVILLWCFFLGLLNVLHEFSFLQLWLINLLILHAGYVVVVFSCQCLQMATAGLMSLCSAKNRVTCRA